MKRFSCDCGQRIFFEDFMCLACGTPIGFSSVSRDMVPVREGSPDGRICRNRVDHENCNWLIPPGVEADYCMACATNSVIPNLSNSRNVELWSRLERAKRRMLYSVIGLGLPFAAVPGRPDLHFQFLESQRGNPLMEDVVVMTGHLAGTITIHLQEADDAYRHGVREAMGERYRTLLGHFRHEIGHFFWDLLVADVIDEFRALFGDEREDYPSAINRYYEHGVSENWSQFHVSAYASAHPLEDWAETWAHYMHIVDGLETARENALGKVPLSGSWDERVGAWMEVAMKINELNRSLGTPDPYPFVLNSTVREKLSFIHRRREAWRRVSAVPEGV